jgi:two-component system response regulator QseB
MHLLLIEDDLDLDLGRTLRQALNVEGVGTEWFRHSAEALPSLAATTFDCILLDLTRLDGNGMKLLSRWRRSSVATPVVVAAARAGLYDRLPGLHGGADDSVVKPSATAEPVSRMRDVCRRSVQQSKKICALDDLEIKPHRHLARVAGKPLDLSLRKFQWMVAVARELGKVFSRSGLSQRLEPLVEALNLRIIEVHMSNLRRSIGAQHERTVPGISDMFQV